jgi:hypothetical protein
MLWLWQGFRQYVGCLLGISATLDGQRSVLDKIPHPMPSGGDMFGSFVELGVSRHRDGAVVVTFDKCWFILFIPELIVQTSQPARLAPSLG